MCGIAGIFTPNADETRDALEASLARMTRAVAHRGPDDSGTWIDAARGIAFGHRRLSINDLSPLGRQPMTSADDRYVFVLNGEIYNFKDLRQELEQLGHRFRGHSDTEIALAAIRSWGVEAALKRLLGMFAFGLWDRQTETLYLARDRLGEKPLYYGWIGGRFVFASELGALRALPFWQGRIDLAALSAYFRHNYVPAPLSIFANIFKLEPGTYLALDRGSASRGRTARPIPYWSLQELASRPTQHLSAAEAVEQLDNLLRTVVRQMLIADVPLGAFLSGGIDSSSVVAAMQAESGARVRTFTIGFEDESYNEAAAAKAIADRLGTEHSEYRLSPEEAAQRVPQAAQAYDEPFADSSQIPTLLISRLARRQVTVALTGDGGDEAFGGYERYRTIDRAWRVSRRFPAALRCGAATGIARTTASPRWARLEALLRAESVDEMYRAVMSYWRAPGEIVKGEAPPSVTNWDNAVSPTQRPLIERLMYLDALTYLPDDLLVKVDRASMQVALETRLPLVDSRIVEFAWSLPIEHKMKDGKGKRLLREVLKRYLPIELFDRPKMGFAIPLCAWLRGPLRAWADDLLTEERLVREGFLNAATVRRLWREHLAGRGDWSQEIWSVLMFEGWLEAAGGASRAPNIGAETEEKTPRHRQAGR